MKPATASIFLKCDYWPFANEARRQDESATDWMFSFLPIHFFGNDWSIHSSLDLCDQSGTRPSFEDERFDTFDQALNRAVELALTHDKFIVVCNDPETGYDLQPDRSRDNGLFINGPAPIKQLNRV